METDILTTKREQRRKIIEIIMVLLVFSLTLKVKFIQIIDRNNLEVTKTVKQIQTKENKARRNAIIIYLLFKTLYFLQVALTDSNKTV